MRQPYLVAGALLVSLWLGAGAVNAQEEPGRMPGSALGAQGTVSEKDQAFITNYIDYFTKSLLSGDPERIAIARGRLVEPYNQGGTETFINFYDQNLANRIGDGLAAKDVAGRLNTMIVARSVRNAKIADVIKAALKDDVTAVVYQAAVAAEAFTGSKTVEIAPKLGLRGPLVDALKKENNGFVLEPLYLALANIPDVVGWEAVLAKIRGRLALHVANPKAGFEAEAAGLRGVAQVIITGKSAGQNIPANIINQLLLNTVRYMEFLIAQPWPQSDPLKAFLKTCEDSAKWAATNSNVAPPKDSVAGGKTKDEQVFFHLEWKKLLKGDPFKFKDEDINIPKPAN